jgi:hypothetical protein
MNRAIPLLKDLYERIGQIENMMEDVEEAVCEDLPEEQYDIAQFGKKIFDMKVYLSLIEGVDPRIMEDLTEEDE